MSHFETELVQELADRALALRARVDRLGGIPALALRLHAAARLDLPDEERGYSIIALCGPTGGGKSTLFNTLLGKDDVSPVGHDNRCCTTQPLVACDKELEPEIRKRLPHVHIVPHRLPVKGLVLVDCPDINGPINEHLERTAAILDAADVAVWVVSGWNYSNKDAWNWLQANGLYRRWWLAATVRENQNPDDIRRSIKNTAHEVGLTVDDEMVHVFDSKQRTLDFTRLKESIFNEDHANRVFIAAHDRKLAAIEGAFTESDKSWLTNLAIRFQAIVNKPSDALTAQYQAIFWQGDGRSVSGIGPSLVGQLGAELQRRVWLAAAQSLWPPISLVAMLRARIQTALVAWTMFRGATAGFSIFRLWSLARAWMSSQWVETAVTRVIERYEKRLQAIDEGLERALGITIRQHGLRLEPHSKEPGDTDSTGLIEDLAADVPVVGTKWSKRLALFSRAGRRTSVLVDDLSQSLDAEIERQVESEARKPRRLTNFLAVLTAVPLLWAAVLLLQTAYLREWLPTTFYLQFVALFLLAMLPASIVLFVSVARLHCDRAVEDVLRAPKFAWLQSGRYASDVAASVDDLATQLETLKEDASRLRIAIEEQAGNSAGHTWRSKPTHAGPSAPPARHDRIKATAS
jgi:hypothetical protein